MQGDHARRRVWVGVIALAISFVSGGATCSRRDPGIALPPPPPILNTTPAMQEVVAAVNRTSSIRELSSNSASVDVLSMPAVPKLSATIALRKDREFRLRARLPIVMGSGLDMGSNNTLFWFEVPEGVSRTLYYASHDQYQQQLARSILPVDPTWVMDALGLVQLDPNTIVDGPVIRPDGKLEVRSVIPTPSGQFQRVCYIDAAAGHVTNQLLYDPNGIKIAESVATNHRYYVEQQCSLPHSVQLALNPPGGQPLEMKIDVGSYVVNQILSGDPNLFVMPQGASNAVDLTRLGPGAAVGMPVAPVSYQQQPDDLAPMPYRGFVAP